MNKRIKKKLEKRDNHFHYLKIHQGFNWIHRTRFEVYACAIVETMIFKIKNEGKFTLRNTNIKRAGANILKPHDPISKTSKEFSNRIGEIHNEYYRLKAEYEDKQIFDFLDREYCKIDRQPQNRKQRRMKGC